MGEGQQQRKIRVVIVDDHEIVRSGLESILSLHDDIEIVAQAEDGAEAVELCESTGPDVVLMDLVMPGMDGQAATQEILRRCPLTKVVALTSFTDEGLVEGAMRAGAIGYLVKNASGKELADAIRAADRGRLTLAPQASEALVHVVTGQDQAGRDLTARERQVLALMAEGLTNREIAQRLIISLSTAKTHVSSIISKLGASSRAEAAAVGVKHHII